MRWLFVFAIWSPLALHGEWLWANTTAGNIGVSVDKDRGVITSVVSGGVRFLVEGSSSLGGYDVRDSTVKVSYCNVDGYQGVCVSRELRSTKYNVTLLDTFTQTKMFPSILSWQLQIVSNSAVYWRAPIQTTVTLDRPALFWVPQGGTGKPFEDVLSLKKNGQVRAELGDGYIYSKEELLGGDPETITPLPMSLFMDEKTQKGVTLVASLDDITLAGLYQANSTAHQYSRYYNRLGKNLKVSFTTYLTSVTGEGWRDALACATQVNKDFLSPVTPQGGPQLSMGLGLYTCANTFDIDEKTVVEESGATHDWDAHFWWPYIGMFLPPVNKTTNWKTNLGGSEQSKCGAQWKHGDTTNLTYMHSFYKSINQQKNITIMPYFNFFEFGQQVKWPLPPKNQDPNDWMDSSQYLANHLADSIFSHPPQYTWQKAVVLDPGVKSYNQFLVNQARMKLQEFGEVIGGLAVDRTDHTRTFSHMRDDGVSWCDSPCASFLLSFVNSTKQVSELLSETKSASGPLTMTANYNAAARVDILRYMDGIFSENSDPAHRPSYVNIVGLSAIQMPALLWTYNANEILNYPTGGPHGWFQHHLYMGVMPFAPVIGADHSITPGSTVQMYYTMYGGLFRKLRNTQWILEANAVSSNATGNVRTNIFQNNQNKANKIVVVVWGDIKGHIPVSVSSSLVLGECSAIHPQSSVSTSASTLAAWDGSNSKLSTTLVNGCVLLDCLQD